MAARPTWSGAISFAGFPINIALHNLTKSKSGESFKQLDPVHKQPVKQVLVDIDGTVVERTALLKGVPQGKDVFFPLPAEAMEMIQQATRTSTLEGDFPPAESVRWEFTNGVYRIVPDTKVPGSEGPVGILWNGLIGSGRAFVTKIVLRAGSADKILAITADDYGLTGRTLAFAEEIATVPEFLPERDEKAATMFEQFLGVQDANIDDFAYEAWKSDYLARRAEAVQAALAGEAITVPDAAPTPAAAPDLMAAMKSALETAKPSAAKKKPAAKAKPKSKAAA